MIRTAVVLIFVAQLACGAPARAPTPVPAPIRLVATERGPSGGRLVALDEEGVRLGDVTSMEPSQIDSHPVFSPDGKRLAFASTRGRKFPETSLWIMLAQLRGQGVRVTGDGDVARDPAWLPRGRGLVYASNQKGTFDLWLLPLDGDTVGLPVQLTSAKTDELTPSISPDGTAIVYMALDRTSGRSTLRLVSLDGADRELTQGPADLTPAWSPDGKSIAFAAPVKGRGDTDLFLLDVASETRTLLIDEPYADQTGPVFSSDGRFVFATSVYRSAENGAPVLSSIVVLDRQRPRTLRVLHDPVAVESRLGVAVFPGPLSVERLTKNSGYVDGLRRAISRELEQRESSSPDAPLENFR